MEEFIWAKQEWEDPRAYDVFHRFYLLQPLAERTVRQAYIRYLSDKRNGEKINPKNIRGIPQRWQWWSVGLTKTGEKPVGSKTWKERAEAYDAYLDQTRTAIKQEHQQQVIAKELEHHERMLLIWEENLSDLNKRMIKLREGAKYDPRDYIKSFQRLIDIRNKIDEFGRRAVGLPLNITEDRLGTVDNKPLQITWKEPEFNEENMGAGMDEVREALALRNLTKKENKNGE